MNVSKLPDPKFASDKYIVESVRDFLTTVQQEEVTYVEIIYRKKGEETEHSKHILGSGVYRCE